MGTYVTNTGLMATYGGQFTLTKMVIDAENSEMHQVRDFIAANWSLFTSHIREKSMTDEQAEEEAQRIFVVVGEE
uniref:Uncharacterized protein n=3 Tax=Enterobacteriaceae TaxID=543 RepID=A0A7L7TTX0_ECOLX|nr:hypothetical protein p99783-3T_00209 [Escherichia coli]